jgi:hypothetical protein
MFVPSLAWHKQSGATHKKTSHKRLPFPHLLDPLFEHLHQHRLQQFGNALRHRLAGKHNHQLELQLRQIALHAHRRVDVRLSAGPIPILQSHFDLARVVKGSEYRDVKEHEVVVDKLEHKILRDHRVLELRLRPVILLRKNGPIFECFPYVCPEPVLVKSSFLNVNGAKRPFLLTHSVSAAAINS